MELISIIIPVYNVEDYLEDCIESVLGQSYKNIEILIIDDGSKDKSKDIAIYYSEKDKRIRLFSQKNMGASVARNRGITEANGKFIMFLDSDDILEENSVSILYEEITKENVDIVSGNWINIDEENNIIDNYNFKDEIYLNNKMYSIKEILSYTFFDPVPSNKLFKKNIIDENNIRFAEVAIGQDLNFFLKYIANCKKIFITNKIIFKYRIRNGSISRTYSLKIKDITESFKNIERYYLDCNRFNIYSKEINSWKIHHLNWQINKIRLINKKEDRLKIINNFQQNTENITIKDMINKLEKRNFIKLKIKFLFKQVYSSNIYCSLYKKFLKKQIL